MKFHKLPHFTRDVTGQHYRRLPSDVSLPRISERRRRLKFRLGNQAEQWEIHHAKQSTDLRVKSYILIKQSFEAEKFPILTNWNRVWSINHLYHAVFIKCEQQDNICYSGVNCALGLSKSIRYCGDFVIAGFVIAGFVSRYFTVILPGFHMLFVIMESSL